MAVYVFRRKGSEINVPEVLLLNIAVVDLFLGIASYPATIVAAFSHRWVFGQTGIVTDSTLLSSVSLYFEVEVELQYLNKRKFWTLESIKTR